jgi:phosphoglycerol transferase MdoB-like AlkP superfamily enzyme
MLQGPFQLGVAYLLFGLVITCLARGGWAEDWDESLLASVLGPPLFTLIAAAVVIRFLSGVLLRGNRPADLLAHSDRKGLADHRLTRLADRPGFESDPGRTCS